MIFLLAVWTQLLHTQVLFNHFTEEKGLPSNSVNALLKDRNGFVWVATTKGVCRFDGHDFLMFDPQTDHFPDLSQSDEFSLYEDQEGIVWIGTRDQGLYACNRQQKSFSHFRHDERDTSSLSDDFVNFVFEDRQGVLWVGVHGAGIDRYSREKGNFVNYRPSDTYTESVARMIDDLISFTPDPDDQNLYWFGSLSGLFTFNTQDFTWKYFPVDKQKAVNPDLFNGSEKAARTLIFDQHRNLWAGTWGGGLLRMNTGTGFFEIFKYEPIQPVNGFRNNIKELVYKSRNEFWVLAPYKGLGVFSLENFQFHFAQAQDNGNRMPMKPSVILTDEEGFIWIGSHSDGLYTANIKASVFQKTELPVSVRELVYDNTADRIYAASFESRGQLVVFDPGKRNSEIYSYHPLLDKSENYFVGILQGKDKTWLVESFNLYFFDGTSIKPFYDFVPWEIAVHKQSQPFFISGAIHLGGELWLGTKFHGLFRIDPEGKTFTNYYYPDPSKGIPGFEEFIYTLFIDPEGRVWYGSENFGYFDYSTSSFVSYSGNVDFPDSDIKIQSIHAFCIDSYGQYLVGTEKNGIAVLRFQEGKLKFLKSLTTANGLPSNDIAALEKDHKGNIWAIAGGNLSRIYGSLDSIENYGYQYGIGSLYCLESISANRIGIGAQNGFYMFHPDSVAPFGYSAKPYIRWFSIFDKPVDFSRILDSAGMIRLNYDQNFFSIEYGLLDYFHPVNRPVSYMLEGIDNSWQTSSNRNSLSYANLAGGNYTFKLKASGESELRLPIFIETPFWKTWWFYVLIAAIVFAGFLVFYRYRLGLIRRQESLKTSYNNMINQLEMKALRAQMNPHFLFNSLNSIRYYILKEEFANASDYITKFSKLLRLILHNSRQNMITLKEEIETLRIYIEFEQMRFSKNFSYEENIGTNVNFNSIMIQPMTLQPFVENAIWHGLMPKENDRRLILNIDRKNGLLVVISGG